ncbi:MAG TPA: methylenetetrahydrofolate reductase [NAD(P)H], partial [Agitococcus sp.]|nr:methylenetetrahydrofolate reductase [NAD(P)H] [Agitococcus sp.]
PISFEFFPTKTEEGTQKLLQVHQRLATLNPAYFSVTYGAGGSTRERTLSIVDQIQQAAPIAVAPHLSCIGDNKSEIAELLHRYKNQGIKHLVALRGDLPSGQMGLGELPYARDLVEFVRQETGDHFHIEVAAYPEMHPQSYDFDSDVKNFIAKVNAGANSAITQFFFNADAYFYFVEKVRKAGVTIPIVPGIMPITNASNLIRFADGCGADIPRWIRKQLAAYGDDTASIKAFGEEVVTKLCQTLLQGGAPSLHFYTMNQAEPTTRLCQLLDLA